MKVNTLLFVLSVRKPEFYLTFGLLTLILCPVSYSAVRPVSYSAVLRKLKLVRIVQTGA